MKNRATILLLILVSSFEYTQAQTQFGIKAGVNYVNNVVDNTPDGSNSDNKYRLGYHAGLFGQIKLSDNFAIRPELLFSNKGYSSEGIQGAQPSGDGSIHLNYINFPVLVSYKVIDKLSFLAGPEFGYLLSAKSKFDSETIDVKENFDNNFDFGLSAGLSYSLSDNLMLEMRYTHGFTSVISAPQLTDEFGNPISSDNNPKFQNRTFQFSASYRLK